MQLDGLFDLLKYIILGGYNKMSYIQEYFMCVVNDKGRQIPSSLVVSHTTITACFVVSGIMDLIKHGFVVYEDENLVIAKPMSSV